MFISVTSHQDGESANQHLLNPDSIGAILTKLDGSTMVCFKEGEGPMVGDGNTLATLVIDQTVDEIEWQMLKWSI